MPYLFPILQVLAAYCFLIVPTALHLSLNVLPFMFGIPLLAGLVNLIIVLKKGRSWSRQTMMNCTLIIKYGLIPFFLLGVLIALLSTLMAFLPLPLLPVFGLITVLLLASGGLFLFACAPYALSYLIKAYREGSHSLWGTILAGISQFVFVFDVISIMIYSIKDRHYRKTTIAVLSATCLIVLLTSYTIGLLLHLF